MSLTVVPTLTELLAHPERVRDLPPEAALSVLGQVAGLTPLLLARVASGNGHGPADDGADELLDVKATARRLGASEDYVYRHAKRLPFTVRQGRMVRFSARGIERYIRQRAGR